MSGATALYRIYSGTGELLYVGISNSVMYRLGTHQQYVDWAHEIGRVDVEHFPDRKQARAAERKAIRSESPRHNVANRPDPKPPTKPKRTPPRKPPVAVTSSQQPSFLTVRRAAKLLHCHERTVRRFIRERRLVAEWRGGWRVRREEVERFVAEATEAKLETGRMG